MKKKNNTVPIGTKFYKYTEEDELEVIRILKVGNYPINGKVVNNSYIVSIEGANSQTYKSDDDLHEYTLLRADAIYNFALVVNAEDNVKLCDVVVLMAKKNDKEPYVICRQMMSNLFHEMLNPDHAALGLSLSQDTCPADINMKSMLICHKLIKTVTINGYLDDTPDTILQLANRFTIQADKVLEKQKQQLKNSYVGLCGSTKELLFKNGFWEDVDKGLNIIVLNDNIENCSLSGEQLIYLENHISYIMNDIHVIEYGHDVDFTKIKTDYMLIRDLNQKLYLINYLRGSFIKQEHLSEEEMQKFTSIKI